MRPRGLDEVVGQGRVVGAGSLLRRMIAADRLSSIILHGPPGTGKTTIAEAIGRELGWHVERENAAAVGVARIREVIEQARDRLMVSGERKAVRTILFLDEIHRFSRSQQDVLLADVERGVLTLIGATTENPLFTVNSALVSRSTLFRLEPLSEGDISALVRRAIADGGRGFGKLDVRVDDGAVGVWARLSDGDARRALAALEIAVLSSPAFQEGGRIEITREDAEQSIQEKAPVYDAGGDQHYDHASVLIKSIRGSDPDAGVYWLARMLDAGEDPRFIARRLAILASEDIGNADPRAIMVAEAAWSLTERIGMPECRITLSQCVIYLALAPKSNASYVAISDAMSDLKNERTAAVPTAFRGKAAPPTADGTKMGAGYRYTHAGERVIAGFGPVGEQDYLGIDKRYVRLTVFGLEEKLGRLHEEILSRRAASLSTDQEVRG